MSETESSQQHSRWGERSPDKDVLRQEIWTTLEAEHASVGNVWSHIPNFVGADQAARRLAELPMWKQAKVIKANPDSPQIPVRLTALQEGKLLYMPVPELKDNLPFVLFDPAELQKRGIPFEEAAIARNAVQVGQKVRFQDMKPVDIVVTGCVAVTRQGGRTGKGAGFADLELGIMRELGIISDKTPIITTVHSIQVVDDQRIVMVGHDSALDWIVTPDEVIETHSPYPQPKGVLWDDVEEDQFRDIPFLSDLRQSLSGKSD